MRGGGAHGWKRHGQPVPLRGSAGTLLGPEGTAAVGSGPLGFGFRVLWFLFGSGFRGGVQIGRVSGVAVPGVLGGSVGCL